VCKTTLQIPSRSTQNEGERKKKKERSPAHPRRKRWGGVKCRKKRRKGTERKGQRKSILKITRI